MVIIFLIYPNMLQFSNFFKKGPQPDNFESSTSLPLGGSPLLEHDPIFDHIPDFDMTGLIVIVVDN
jgi:hypothetical protein